jgi:hypothetical protein
LGNQPEFRGWRKNVWQFKLRLSALNAAVNELGKMVFEKLVMEMCSDIIALTVTVDSLAEIQSLALNFHLFLFRVR